MPYDLIAFRAVLFSHSRYDPYIQTRRCSASHASFLTRRSARPSPRISRGHPFASPALHRRAPGHTPCLTLLASPVGWRCRRTSACHLPIVDHPLLNILTALILTRLPHNLTHIDYDSQHCPRSHCQLNVTSGVASAAKHHTFDSTSSDNVYARQLHALYATAHIRWG